MMLDDKVEEEAFVEILNENADETPFPIGKAVFDDDEDSP